MNKQKKIGKKLKNKKIESLSHCLTFSSTSLILHTIGPPNSSILQRLFTYKWTSQFFYSPFLFRSSPKIESNKNQNTQCEPIIRHNWEAGPQLNLARLNFLKI